MLFKTVGNRENPAILFFHAMGVTGDSSLPVVEYLKSDYYCILPTSSVYCENQEYMSKEDEIEQVTLFLMKEEIDHLAMVVASSIGADLAMAFLSNTKVSVDHVFIDGGQFAQISKSTRKIMVPFLYLAIKSLYWSKGKTLKKILWCDDESIKPFFIKAGKNLTYKNIHKQMMDSLEDKEFPYLSNEFQSKCYFEFGSIEEHFKYRDNVMKVYPNAHYPVFDGYNHMQLQIRNPKKFAQILDSIIQTDCFTF